MPILHSMILAPIFTRLQVLRNHQQMPEIRGKSGLVHEWQSHTVNYKRNIWHIKYLDLLAIQNPDVWNEFWLKNTSAMTYSQWESKIQGSGKFGEEFWPQY